MLFPALRKVVSGHGYDALGEDGFEKSVERVAAIEEALGRDDLASFTPKAKGAPRPSTLGTLSKSMDGGYLGGIGAPAATQALKAATKSAWGMGTGARPTPGSQPQRTSLSWSTWSMRA